MKLFVTTFDLRPEAVRALAARDCDGIELRAETATVPVDLAALRAVTSKPLLLTYRGVRVDDARIAGAIQAGIDLVDVDWRRDIHIELVATRYRPRNRPSHHHSRQVPDVLATPLHAMLAGR